MMRSTSRIAFIQTYVGRAISEHGMYLAMEKEKRKTAGLYWTRG
ncbi:unnamed protein product [Musa textilis]